MNTICFRQPIAVSLFLLCLCTNMASGLDERFVNWKPENGLSFDGASTCYIVNDAKAFNVPAITLETWIKFNHTSDSQIFLNRGEPGTVFTLYSYNGAIRMLVQDQSGYSHANAEIPPAQEWFHCVGTMNEKGEKRLYFNGILVGQHIPGSSTNYKAIESSSPLVIGALQPTLTHVLDRAFNGEMENIRIWNRELSAAEIREQLQAKPEEENIPELKTKGLIAYWASRSLQDKTLRDLTGNGNDAVEVESSQEPVVITLPRADGYQGIWYSNQRSDDQYRYKYSGGLGTYCAKHRHHAQYVPEVNKTFFVYGGTKGLNTAKPLLIMISYYDHETGTVPKPAIIMEKGTEDAHHNPALTIDGDGHLWVFASAHGGKDGFIWKSAEPYSIDKFELVMQREFTYPQPQYVEGFGFVFFFTKYTGGRECYYSTSPDGYTWTPDQKIAGFNGHYQVSSQRDNKQCTAFNWHPETGGLNARTNLYYMQTEDFGKTWTNIQGEKLTVPLDNFNNNALVHNFRLDRKLVYMKDITFDREGNPVILVILSKGYESGPDNGPREWVLAHWVGSEWVIKKVTDSDHNYDVGSLYIEDDGVWRIIAPTQVGPQAYCTGGEIAIWISKDQGETWEKVRQLTNHSELNHTYVRRPVNAHPDFYAFWADGNALEPSESSLYFCNKEGTQYWKLPRTMNEESMRPQLMPSSQTGVRTLW
jgi:hypothetical protein